MNKYKRLFVFIVMCLSLIFMLMYRYKYSRLNTLFELMQKIPDSIAKTRNSNVLLMKESPNIDFQKSELSKGMSYWTEIFPDLFVYSTYWLSGKTRTLFFSQDLELHYLDDIQCELIYNKTQPPSFYTEITFVYIETVNDKRFFYLDCKPNDDIEIPKSLFLAYKNFTSTIILPKFDKRFQTNKYAMCVRPLAPAFFKVHELLGFIIHHSNLGIKFFLFYEEGLSFEAKKLLYDIALKDGIFVLVKPWNLPFESRNQFDTTEVAFLDCLHYVVATNQSNVVFKTGIQDFIFLFRDYKLEHLMKHLNFTKQVLNFHEKLYCLELTDDLISHNLNIKFLTLLKNKSFFQKNVSNAVAFDVINLKEHILSAGDFKGKFENKLVGETQVILDEAMVYSYRNCGDVSKLKAVYDKTMWKYKKAYFNSHVYLLAKKFKVITD